MTISSLPNSRFWIALTLGLFAGASGDHNPIHIDLDFAKRFAKNAIAFRY